MTMTTRTIAMATTTTIIKMATIAINSHHRLPFGKDTIRTIKRRRRRKKNGIRVGRARWRDKLPGLYSLFWFELWQIIELTRRLFLSASSSRSKSSNIIHIRFFPSRLDMVERPGPCPRTATVGPVENQVDFRHTCALLGQLFKLMMCFDGKSGKWKRKMLVQSNNRFWIVEQMTNMLEINLGRIMSRLFEFIDAN